MEYIFLNHIDRNSVTKYFHMTIFLIPKPAESPINWHISVDLSTLCPLCAGRMGHFGMMDEHKHTRQNQKPKLIQSLLQTRYVLYNTSLSMQFPESHYQIFFSVASIEIINLGKSNAILSIIVAADCTLNTLPEAAPIPVVLNMSYSKDASVGNPVWLDDSSLFLPL